MIHSAASPAPTSAEIGWLRKAFASGLIQDSTLEHLAAAARRARCRPGPLELDSPCTPVPSWWLVLDGRVSLGARTADGTFMEKRGIGPGEWLDVAGALSGARTWVDQAVCLTSVSLLALPLSELFAACTQDTALAQAFGRVMAGQVRSLNERMNDLTTVDVPIRLARWLLRLIDPEGAVQMPIRVVLQERKQTIAQQLGTTAETLSRTLRRLADAGIVEVRRYELTIHDVSALHSLAHPHGLRRRAPAALIGVGRRAVQTAF